MQFYSVRRQHLTHLCLLVLYTNANPRLTQHCQDIQSQTCKAFFVVVFGWFGFLFRKEVKGNSRIADAHMRHDSMKYIGNSFQMQEVCSNKYLFFSLLPVFVTSSSHPSIACTSLQTPGTSNRFWQSHSFLLILSEFPVSFLRRLLLSFFIHSLLSQPVRLFSQHVSVTGIHVD